MAKTIEQQIAEEKARLKKIQDDAIAATAAAESSKAAAVSTNAIKKKIAGLQSKLNYINDRIKPYIKRVASGEKLSSTDQAIFDGLSEQFNSVKSEITQTSFPGAVKPSPVTPTPTGTPTGAPTGTPTQTPGTPAVTPNAPSVTPGSPKPKPKPKPKPGAPKPKPKPGEPTPTPAEKKKLTIDEIIDAVANEYGSIDTIFKTDPGLQALLRKAIGKDGVPYTDDDLTVDQFTNELENTDWFKTNASSVRQRGFYKRQFDDLVKKGGKLEDLYKTTEYGRGLKFTQQVIADEIKKVGATLTPEEIDLISRDIYDLGYENQKAIVSQRIRAKIAYKPGGIVGGEAGENLADLRKTAKANGLDLEKNFGSSIQGWLQNLAQGESVETFKQIIRSTAKLGLPEKAAALLDQGVDLDTIYSPYKKLMASVLEINPETISLDDQVLRSAIGPDKEMSLYDYQKMLRKDNRWQYTNQAKEEVSDTALRVLRDFGFQG
jgi:hypothetical protein